MKTLYIDVREPEEFASGHAPGAINVPPSKLMNGPSALGDIPLDTPLVLYCKTGSRSNVAMHILRGYGFTNLTNGINQDHVRQSQGRD